MTTAEEIVVRLDGHRIRQNEYRARCPVHQGKSDTSLSIKEVDDRVLLYCHGGCTLSDILTALRLKAADLFRAQLQHDQEADRRRRAAEVLKNWHQAETQRVAEELRRRDKIARIIGEAVQAGTIPEDETYGALAAVWIGYDELEWYFERLRTEDPLTLWREQRRHKTESMNA